MNYNPVYSNSCHTDYYNTFYNDAQRFDSAVYPTQESYIQHQNLYEQPVLTYDNVTGPIYSNTQIMPTQIIDTCEAVEKDAIYTDLNEQQPVVLNGFTNFQESPIEHHNACIEMMPTVYEQNINIDLKLPTDMELYVDNKMFHDESYRRNQYIDPTYQVDNRMVNANNINRKFQHVVYKKNGKDKVILENDQSKGSDLFSIDNPTAKMKSSKLRIRTNELYRQVYKPEQREILEREYKIRNVIDPENRERIAKETGLNIRQVKLWFQNRRAKDKRESKKQKRLTKNN